MAALWQQSKPLPVSAAFGARHPSGGERCGNLNGVIEGCHPQMTVDDSRQLERLTSILQFCSFDGHIRPWLRLGCLLLNCCRVVVDDAGGAELYDFRR